MGSLGDCSGGNEERIYVSVRLKPLNVSEIYRNDVSDWECINDDTIVYKNACLSASERCMYPTLYTYDRVFGSECTTREVYEKGARDVAISVLHGMNSTIFAYGQTSSGKTYTMTGITEYALADIYEYIRKNPDRDFVLKFSAMEIYNESVRDLLSMDSTPLRLLDDPERGTVVEKLTEEVISDWSHVIHLLSVSKAQRQIGETLLNEMSSRSHQIIRLTIESSSQDSRSSLTASVNFVDLAGSERASQSYSAGTRLKEGCHINRSLLTLGTVIRKLSKGRGGHIPYRDSKLTRILQTSLGGNARTAIICTMSLARSHIEQSRNTLLFASCAKEVTTSAQVNVVMSDKALVKCLQKKVEKLEDELRSSQSTYVSANFTAFLRERDLQIEKLEADIKELVLQRDIAQSKVRDMLQILEGNTRLSEQVGFDHYPHFRVVRSTDSRIEETETSHRADPCSFFVDTRAYYDEHGDISLNIGTAKVSYAHENLVVISPRISVSSSSISESYSFNGWDETEKQSDVSSEYMCKEVRCIETADAEESDSSCSKEESYRYPQEFVSGALESLSTPEKGYEQSSSRSARERNTECETENQEDSHSPLLEETKSKLIHLLETPVGNRLINEIDRDSSIHGKQESILDSASSLFKMGFSDNTPSFDTERAQKHFEREPTPVSSCSNFQSSATKNLQFSPESDVHTQIVGPNLKLWDMEDVNGSNKETAEILTEQQLGEIIIQPRIDHPTNKNTKDVSLDPIEGESASSWDIAFKTLQQEIIELWHACKVSLTHRTYFFLLFQGDASDSAYLEVEQRRMKFLKKKLSAGETIFFNRKMITLTSSGKALHEERKMLCRRMLKKLCEQERETLFLKWGISLNSKHRRLQLAQCLWDQPKDMDRVLDSALLIAKLMNFIAPAVATNKEMLGIDFTLNKLPTTFRFKRGIISLP